MKKLVSLTLATAVMTGIFAVGALADDTKTTEKKTTKTEEKAPAKAEKKTKKTTEKTEKKETTKDSGAKTDSK